MPTMHKALHSLTSLLLAVLVLALSVVAASPEWHRQLHADSTAHSCCSQEEANPHDADCPVCLLGTSLGVPQAPPLELPLGIPLELKTPKQAPLELSAPPGLHPPALAPPVCYS